MNKRLNIPIDIKKELITECGNRCAICGNLINLEISPITQIKKKKLVRKENYICLCKKCVYNSRNENWSKNILFEYKRIPWICRRIQDSISDSNIYLITIQIIVEIAKNYIRKNIIMLLKYGIAAFLEIHPNDINILENKKDKLNIFFKLILTLDKLEKLKQTKKIISFFFPFKIINIIINTIEELKSISKNHIKDIKEKNKLFIHPGWYLLVDDEGFFIDDWNEGAMGFILQLRNKENSKNIRALKIPRLVSESQKENSYINQIIKDEGEFLYKINPNATPTPGLLFGDIFLNNVFRNQLNLPGNAQDNQIIGVQLRKNRAPRLCGFKKTKKGVQFFPKKKKDISFFTIELIDKIIDAGMGGCNEWINTIVYEHKDEGNIIIGFNKEGKIQPYAIEKSLLIDNSETNWYFGIPAVVYGWGLGTLENAIKSNKLKDWKLEDYLKFFLNILNGLIQVHRKKSIHADIRPANIMYSENLKMPSNYYLIDYAGYNTGRNPVDPQKNEPNSGHGHTQIGASIGRERYSPFYSPVRRIAIENEDADIAIFIKENNEFMFIYLGWFKECIKDGKENSQIIKSIKKCKIKEKIFVKKNKSSIYLEDELQKGDRLQIKEYIFEVEGVGQVQKRIVYKCKIKHWKIAQSQIVIKDEDNFFKDKSVTSLSVLKYIKLKQWSAAVDIYSIGAIFLYLIFFGKNNNENENESSTDSEFHNLLLEFEKLQFFQEIWPELATICLNFNKIPLSGITYEEIIMKTINLNKYKIKLFLNTVGNKSINLINYSKYVTKLIISTIKGTKKIYENLNFNYVYFIYCICFILCCLHKRIELPENKFANYIKKADISRFSNDQETESIYKEYKDLFLVLPFASNRTPKPRDNIGSAINLCQNFLTNFNKFVNSTTFIKFIDDFSTEKEMDDFSLPVILKFNNQKLNDRNNYLFNKLKDIIKYIKEARLKCKFWQRNTMNVLDKIIKFINKEDV